MQRPVLLDLLHSQLHQYQKLLQGLMKECLVWFDINSMYEVPLEFADYRCQFSGKRFTYCFSACTDIRPRLFSKLGLTRSPNLLA